MTVSFKRPRSLILAGALLALQQNSLDRCLVSAQGTQSPPWVNVPLYANAPSSLPSPPVGCTCATSDTPCTKYDCPCVCDLRAGVCDPNCCCDPLCTGAEVASFQATGSCLPQGPANLTLRRCIDLNTDRALVYVNPKSRMSVASVPGMDRVLCVSVDNNPVYGSYLSDPGSGSTLFSRTDASRAYTFNPPVRGAGTAAAAATGFSVGDAVPVGVVDSGGLRAAFGGSWTLPRADDAGVCTGFTGGGAGVAYRTPARPAQCTLTRPLSAATCEALSGVRRIRALRVGSAPGSQPQSTGWISVTVDAVLSASTSSGNVTLLAAAGSGTGGAILDAAAFDASTCTCSGAVVGAAYRVYYSVATSTITAVNVDVMVASISSPVATCGVASLQVPVYNSVTWLPDAQSATATAATNDLDPTERSGAPGYLLGAPVLAGVLVNVNGGSTTSPAAGDKLAIVRSSPSDRSALFAAAANATGAGTSLMGLYVRGPATDGSCVPATSPSAALGGDTSAAVPLAFGEDVTFGCSLSLTPAAFASMCSTSPASVTGMVGLGTVDPGTGLRTPATHVGILGNADPGKAWEWMPLDVSAVPAAASYLPLSSTCSGVASGVRLDFLVARVGEKLNPQRKIVAARVSYVTDTWKYGREDVRTTGATAARFTLTTTVTWTELSPVAQDYVPPAPPVIPPLPGDLFYPFLTTASSSDSQLTVSHASTTAPSLAAIAMLAVATLALLAAGR